ncbi:MAG: ATP synthase F1 subunit gamma [Oscillospiraceae bacterium]|nr:ATP synthase F1 subunit gamma [Oscillospiraceae bacterium]
MPSKKAIKLRKASVGTIKQIVKAMNMVAATKLQRSKARLASARPLFTEAKRMMDAISQCNDTRGHLFFREPTGTRVAYALITSDRGLCGSYNTNVSAEALKHIEEGGREEYIYAIGTRGRLYFQRRGKNIVETYPGMSETAFYEDARAVAHTLLDLYVTGQVDEVYVAYTRFESVLSHVPRLVRLLPIGPLDADTPEATGDQAVRFEPEIDTVLEYAVPAYLSAVLYGALQESGCSEQAARMLSMDAATKSAGNIIEDLKRAYNRKRQAGITQEIAEIVGGANVTN